MKVGSFTSAMPSRRKRHRKLRHHRLWPLDESMVFIRAAPHTSIQHRVHHTATFRDIDVSQAESGPHWPDMDHWSLPPGSHVISGGRHHLDEHQGVMDRHLETASRSANNFVVALLERMVANLHYQTRARESRASTCCHRPP